MTQHDIIQYLLKTKQKQNIREIAKAMNNSIKSVSVSVSKLTKYNFIAFDIVKEKTVTGYPLLVKYYYVPKKNVEIEVVENDKDN